MQRAGLSHCVKTCNVSILASKQAIVRKLPLLSQKHNQDKNRSSQYMYFYKTKHSNCTFDVLKLPP